MRGLSLRRSLHVRCLWSPWPGRAEGARRTIPGCAGPAPAPSVGTGTPLPSSHEAPRALSWSGAGAGHPPKADTAGLTHRGSGFIPKVGWAPSLGRRKTADGDCWCREYARFQRGRVCWLSSVGRKSFLCPRSCVKTNKAGVHVMTCPATTWVLVQGGWTGRPRVAESPEGAMSSARA